MPMLADTVELVIGVDTHKDTHTAAVVQAVSGAFVDQVTVPATPAGYQQLLRLADRQDGRRVWAIEGTGGYGAGLTRFLHGHAERVVELDRPKRAVRRHGAKSDSEDVAGEDVRPGIPSSCQPRAATAASPSCVTTATPSPPWSTTPPLTRSPNWCRRSRPPPA